MISAKFIYLVSQSNLVVDLLTLIAFLTITACFIVFVVLTRLGRLKKEHKSLYVLVFVAVIMVEQVAEFVRFNGNFWHSITFPTINLCFSLIYYVFILISEDKVKVKKEHKDLINLIDEQIKNESEPIETDFSKQNDVGLDNQNAPKITIESILPRQIVEYKNNSKRQDLSFNERTPNESKCLPYLKDKAQLEKDRELQQKFGDLDFTHVKNILARLEYYSLSSQEKRQVEQLKSYVLDAERGKDDPNLKGKINDGLGALLKIMAKHGV